MYEPLKQYGQNFLEDPKYINSMVDNLELAKNDLVIEIGPGLGALTQSLIQKSANLDISVIAVEIDPRFVVKLNTMFIPNANVEIVEKDILKYLPDFETSRPFKILGSLPFYITSPILHQVIKMKKQPERCVFLVQKEVAQKITNQAPDASYLSTFVQTFYDADYVMQVPRAKFFPEPNVDGAIIVLRKKTHVYQAQFINSYEDFLHRCFRFPRKMIRHSFPTDVLDSVGINPTFRPEAVQAEKWLALFGKV